MNYKTEQEKFWSGSFGDDYINRNQGADLLASNIRFFAKSLNVADKISSCIEFGANIGMNLQALKLLYPNQDQHAVEINAQAAEHLAKIIPSSKVYNTSILEFSPKETYDLVLIKGVLIHINPDQLNAVYDKLCQSTSRYILLSEYYNPTPVEVNYRGHGDRLFKRDFAGELLERHPEFELVDYGFSYRGDRAFPKDDGTWFLMQRR